MHEQMTEEYLMLFFSDLLFLFFSFIQCILYLHFRWYPLSWIPYPWKSHIPSKPPFHKNSLPSFLSWYSPTLLHWVFPDQWPLLPSSWASFDMWIISWVFWTSGVICAYQWVHTMCVLLWLGHLTQDDILQFHPLA